MLAEKVEKAAALAAKSANSVNKLNRGLQMVRRGWLGNWMGGQMGSQPGGQTGRWAASRSMEGNGWAIDPLMKNKHVPFYMACIYMAYLQMAYVHNGMHPVA